MVFLRRVFEAWLRFRMKKHGQRVLMSPTTRLLRHFSINFLATPVDRVYLRVGDHCLINANITFESSDGYVEIGDRTYIGVDTTIISRNSIKIGNDVTMAWGITIYDHNSHSIDWRQRASVVDHFYRTYGTPDCFDMIDWTDVASAPIVISDRVWIGFDAVILKGVMIGEGAIVATRSVVTRDVEPYTVVAGNPAAFVRRLAHNVT